FLGKLFQNGMSIVFVVVFARLLGVEQYGIYKLVVVITTIAAAVGLLGMEGGIKRFLALAGKSGEENRVWGIIQVGTALPFLFALLLSAAIALGADPLAR
ncbi:MAG: oligosaccharide flippase family protein, partial [Calditrichaeota bacterium]|nr:oligosaccharide flippase family protein [Calditrichota bacterium]